MKVNSDEGLAKGGMGKELDSHGPQTQIRLSDSDLFPESLFDA